MLRTTADGEQTVTEGPYAETAEQLTGFYVVESDDLDDLIEVCKVLGKGEGAIEIRAYGGAGDVTPRSGASRRFAGPGRHRSDRLRARGRDLHEVPGADGGRGA